MKRLKNKRKTKINISALIIISLVLLLTSGIVYFFQTNIFPIIPISGITPNLFVIFILVIGLFGNNLLAILFGIITGLFIDFTYNEIIGITPAMLCLVGFIATWFDSLWSKDEKISIIIMVILSTFIFELGSYFLKSLILDFAIELGPFFKILFWEEIYNILITIIIFGIIKKLGYIMERKLKRNNMYSIEM